MAVDGIVLLSGGLDSMVLAYQLVSEGKRIRLLYFDFEKEPSPMELASAKLTSLELHAPLEVVDLRGIVKMQLGYESWQQLNADEADIFDPQPIGGFIIPLSVADYYASLVEIYDLYVAVLKPQGQARPGLK